MPFLLNIDTATSRASVCLSNNEEIISIKENDIQKEHASFVHTAVDLMLKETGLTLGHVEGVAVTSGPGSYTGLRVGLASAKGFCFALKKPLICVNTLEVMAVAGLREAQSLGDIQVPFYLCPMIDARRMEVFTAVYDTVLHTVLTPCALLLQERSFLSLLDQRPVIFFGDGCVKAKAILQHKNTRFINVDHSAGHLAIIANQLFKENRFADAVYAEPIYFKEFVGMAEQNKS